MTTMFTCPNHGTYGDPAGLGVIRICPACEAEAAEQERQFRQSWRSWTWWLDQSGVPDRYRTKTVGNWQPTTAGQTAIGAAAQRYVDNLQDRMRNGNGLTLLGPPGTGKTHLAAAVVNAACAAGVRAQYASWPDLIERHRRGQRQPADHPDREAMQRAADAEFLALDEIGLDSGTDWTRAALFELIDSRYRDELATIVCCNATLRNLPAMIGERIADRLVEMSPALVLAGDSKRGQAKRCDIPALTPPPKQLTVTVCDSGHMVERVIEAPERWLL